MSGETERIYGISLYTPPSVGVELHLMQDSLGLEYEAF